MLLLELPEDCIDEITRWLDICSYYKWKQTSPLLEYIVSIDQTYCDIFNGDWKHNKHRKNHVYKI